MSEEEHTEERMGEVRENLVWIAVADHNRVVVEEFRASGGRVGGMFEGAPMVLVTTTGARTGRRITTPLIYLGDGERNLVFASNAGAPINPAWYHNIVANPDVIVEQDSRTYTATAVPVHGDERDRLYARQAALNPAYAEYQANTARTIPVVALHPHQS